MSSPRPDTYHRVVVIPIKSFAKAKSRLAGVLNTHDRATLAKSLASEVLQAAHGCTVVVVVSDDQRVLDWVGDRAQLLLLQPQAGLNEALRYTSEYVRQHHDTRRMLVCHSDVHQPGPLRQILSQDRSVIAPDGAGGGTNLMSVAISPEFRFAYGDASYARHVRALKQQGRGPILHLWNSSWSNDVDTPADLQRLGLV